jgi:uncharacterized protein YprB with RNaseH-like and TPR domain
MSSSQLTPVAFDIETSGFDTDAVITVAGFAHSLGESLILNTGGHSAVDRNALAVYPDFGDLCFIHIFVIICPRLIKKMRTVFCC